VRPRDIEADIMPIYKSEDGGLSWRLIHKHTSDPLLNYPAYMTERHPAWAISKIRVDREHPNRIIISNLYGVAISEDNGYTYNAHQFQGLESVCLEHISPHPTKAGTFYVTLADHSPSMTHTNGDSYEKVTHLYDRNPGCIAFVASRYREDLLLYSIRGRDDQPSCIVRSEDGGQSIKIMIELPDHVVQCLVEDPFIEGRFFALLEGDLAKGAGLYVSEDWGETWQPTHHPYPEHVEALPHEKYWLEAAALYCGLSGEECMPSQSAYGVRLIMVQHGTSSFL